MTTKQAKQKRQNRLGTVLAILIFLLGLGILFYPVASDLWNQHRQNQLISHYTQSTTTLAPEDHSALWEAAQEYNKNLSPTFRDAFTGRQLPAGDPYWGLLDPDGSGIMGYIEIPRISVRLPIYHGTSEEVLQHGIGHLGGTSLPVGGEGAPTRCFPATGGCPRRCFSPIWTKCSWATIFPCAFWGSSSSMRWIRSWWWSRMR